MKTVPSPVTIYYQCQRLWWAHPDGKDALNLMVDLINSSDRHKRVWELVKSELKPAFVQAVENQLENGV